MGFNTLWLSPLYTAPTGTFSAPDGHRYSGYHGYWPVDSRSIDPRFGTAADVDSLIAAAHGRGFGSSSMWFLTTFTPTTRM